MDGEKKIEAWQQELIMVRSGMEEMGPIVIGTISSSRKKYRTKDGEVRCRKRFVSFKALSRRWNGR